MITPIIGYLSSPSYAGDYMLSPEQISRLTEHINTKWARKECRQCGSNSWAVEGFVLLSISDQPGQLVLGGPSLPTVSLVCNICGNTVLVNAIVAGVLPPTAQVTAPPTAVAPTKVEGGTNG